MRDKLIVASLFSGCGGMDLGMNGGFEYLGRLYKRHPTSFVYAADYDRKACEVYNENFNHKCLTEDINKVASFDIPPHHILTGGFPCQSFSIVAQNPPRLGYKDANGRLFFEMCRILQDRKPMAFIAENVKGILSANKGKAFPLIIKNFEKAGYHVAHSILDASEFGIPQRRHRVFIIGFRDKKMLDYFKFPRPRTVNNKVPLKKVLEDEVEEKYYFSNKALRGLKAANNKHGDMNKGRAQNINEPCNTVGAHLAKVSLNSTDPVLLQNGRFRMFTPREVARVQSFPENYKLSGSKTKLYKALGNAVPPVLMWYLTRSVVTAMKKVDKNIFRRKLYRTEKEKRSFNMSKIRGKNTSIELLLQNELKNRGYKFITNVKDIIGKPDIVFEDKKIAIFCDSSFWHGRNINKDKKRIKANNAYWRKKLESNLRRDKEVTASLKKSGWEVLRFWDNEIKQDLENIVSKIALFIGG